MDTSLTLYLFSLSILIVITTGISIRVLRQWNIPGARTLGFLMLSMTVWAVFYLIEILHPDLAMKIFARKMLYLGMGLAPALWLGFALRYTGIHEWWSRRGRIFLLTIPAIISFFLGFTNEFHGLIWVSHSLAQNQPAPLMIEYGPAFWLCAAIAYGMIATGIIVYIIAFIKSDRVLRVKTGIMLLGVFLTAIVNFIFLFYGKNHQLDPTPISFAISAPLIAFGFFRFGISSLFPLAAVLVVENLRDAIIVVNKNDEITDINQSALKRLGLKISSEKQSAFSTLPEPEQFKKIWNSPEANFKFEHVVEEGISKWYEARVIPIPKTGADLVGRAVILHDISNEQMLLRAERRRSQFLSLLEETGRHIADSFEELEILQRTVDSITRLLGYPETAISLLTPDNMLEIAVISGTEDFNYQPGYRQEFGSGIIGYTASLKKTYITGDVSKDRHYFSTSDRSGSALCTPIFKQGVLYGVLYVESFELQAFDIQDVLTLETLATQVSESLQRALLFAQTRENLRTLETIQDVSKLVASSLDLETISQTVVESLKQAFGYSHVSIYFLQDEYLHLAAQTGYPEDSVIRMIHISQGVAGKTIRTKTAQFIENTTKEDTFLRADIQVTSEICVPLLKDDLVLGVLNVESTPQKPLRQSDVDLLTAIAGPIAVAVDNARLHMELKKMATTDAVTGLSNRHVFEQALVAEVERAGRNGTPVSLIIFDIDYFKEYNDQWGHPAGDARLKAVADIIKVNLRKYDVAARYGGDEFAIILSDCNQQNASTFAERLHQSAQIESPEMPENDKRKPGHTLSIGIATYPQDAIQSNELLIAADHAAMRAKQQGRNRIKLASDYETN
ncbi:MAG: diguanylate cyclase [Anaerolineae bacterium]|nr:diguanylate cyclase [Anaerolineae bacterium]